MSSKPRTKPAFFAAFEAGRSGHYKTAEEAWAVYTSPKLPRTRGRKSSITEDQKQFILKHYESKGRRWVLENLKGVTRNQVDHFAKVNNLTVSSSAPFARKDIQIKKAFPNARPQTPVNSVFNLAASLVDKKG